MRNRTGVEICPAGSISGIGQDNCTLCEIGKFSEAAGSDECRFCNKEDAVVGSVTEEAGSKSVEDCVCPEKKYKRVEDVDYPTCIDVPKGVSVEVSGMDRFTLVLEKGFYRVSESLLEILQCERDACAGGDVSGEEICEEGSGGKLCSVCESGYATVGIGPMKSCVACEGDKTATLAVFGGGGILVLIFAVWKAWKAYKGGVTELERGNEARERSLSAAKKAAKKVKKAKKTMSKIGPVVKIVMSYGQIISCFGSVFDVRFPPMFSGLTGIFGALANLNFIDFMPIDCVFER